MDKITREVAHNPNQLVSKTQSKWAVKKLQFMAIER